MNQLEKFKTVRALEIALFNDAGICDYDNRHTFDFGELEAKKLAEDYFGTIPSNHSPAYKRLLKAYQATVEDYDERRD